MSVIHTNSLRAGGFAVAPRLTRLVEAIVTRVTTAAQARATRHALERLSDRELEDIGLTRAEIYRRF